MKQNKIPIPPELAQKVVEDYAQHNPDTWDVIATLYATGSLVDAFTRYFEMMIYGDGVHAKHPSSPDIVRWFADAINLIITPCDEPIVVGKSLNPYLSTTYEMVFRHILPEQERIIPIVSVQECKYAIEQILRYWDITSGSNYTYRLLAAISRELSPALRDKAIYFGGTHIDFLRVLTRISAVW